MPGSVLRFGKVPPSFSSLYVWSCFHLEGCSHLLWEGFTILLPLLVKLPQSQVPPITLVDHGMRWQENPSVFFSWIWLAIYLVILPELRIWGYYSNQMLSQIYEYKNICANVLFTYNTYFNKEYELFMHRSLEKQAIMPL